MWWWWRPVLHNNTIHHCGRILYTPVHAIRQRAHDPTGFLFKNQIKNGKWFHPPDQHFMNQPWAYVGCGDCVTLEKSQSTWLFCLNPVRSKKHTDNNSIWICYKRSLTQKKKKNPHERLNKLNRCTREREGGFWYQTHDGIIVYGPWFDIHYGTETNCLCVCALNDCLKRSPSWEMNFTYLARGVRIRNSIWGGKRRFISTVFQLKEKEKFPIFNPKSK